MIYYPAQTDTTTFRSHSKNRKRSPSALQSGAGEETEGHLHWELSILILN